jgi:pimeloyl-ACP methyl ester carboxylesterase
MKHHTITGGDGVQLHVVETGNPGGRPILFIHGLSQCWLAWARQLNSDLADRYRLLAMDMRGHGLSEKPRDGYADSRLWADDVAAVLRALTLDRPILCGWSYGPLVILDYVRHYGEEALGAMTFVDGITKLGSEEAASVLTRSFSTSFLDSFPRTWTKVHKVFSRCCGCASLRNPRRRICTSCWGTMCRFHPTFARRSSLVRSTTMIFYRRSGSLC